MTLTSEMQKKQHQPRLESSVKIKWEAHTKSRLKGAKMSKINMIRREGGSRVLAVTKVIPLNWQVVDIEIIKLTKDLVTLKIRRVK